MADLERLIDAYGAASYRLGCISVQSADKVRAERDEARSALIAFVDVIREQAHGWKELRDASQRTVLERNAALRAVTAQRDELATAFAGSCEIRERLTGEVAALKERASCEICGGWGA